MAARHRIRPLTALRAMRRLTRDPDDTAQAIVVIAALAGNWSQRLLRRFHRSPRARAILRERRDLYALLSDREGLLALPPGSLGRAIGEWFARERIGAEGLARAALQARTQLGSAPLDGGDEQILVTRLMNLHDVFHVLTGYDRDLRGEAAVLAFTLAQTRSPGMAFIVLRVLLHAGWSSEMGRLIRQGYRRGRRSAWLIDQDWETLLTRPIDEVRNQLGVGPPPRYEQLRSPGAPPLMAS